jgi:hypothetical protein
MIVRIKIQRQGQGAHFVHPMNPPPRTAILAPGFHSTRNMRVFPLGWDQRARRFHPQSVAAPPAELRRLADQGLHLESAVIVLTHPGEEELTAEDRDMFWCVFGVPVYEQYLDHKNRLLAMECDAHSGLHVLRGGEIDQEWREHLRLEREACACGDRSPRVTRVPRIHELVELLA